MKLDDQVCSLELAKRLKELGVKQNALFSWNKYGTFFTQQMEPEDSPISAFTVSELGEMLPTEDEQNYTVVTYRGPSGFWFCDLTNFKGESGLYPKVIREDTEADARAKMLIHLIEKGIVKP